MNELHWWEVGNVGVVIYLALTLYSRIQLMRREEVTVELFEIAVQEQSKRIKEQH
tara:strand:+ start:32 stop:196 length:165 start_codon:yes stop_codon:yes gene_type:complete